MEIRPIRNEADYQAALAEIDRLMDAAKDTPDGDRLDVLATLVEAYERRHFPMPLPTPVEAIKPTPVEAIKFVMEQRSLSAKDLEPMIGRSNRVYEILSGKRALTLPMIRRLHEGLGIPLESLIGRGDTVSHVA